MPSLDRRALMEKAVRLAVARSPVPSTPMRWHWCGSWPLAKASTRRWQGTSAMPLIAPVPNAQRPTAIVLDASIVVELILAYEAGKRAMARLVAANAPLHAPELLDVEVRHVLRRAQRGLV